MIRFRIERAPLAKPSASPMREHERSSETAFKREIKYIANHHKVNEGVDIKRRQEVKGSYVFYRKEEKEIQL
jgi:hypothetical protein